MLFLSIYTVARDLFIGSANTGNDLAPTLIALGSRLVTSVLTSTGVATKLAVYFGAEEVKEAIPFIGWTFKVLALEATTGQSRPDCPRNHRLASCRRIRSQGDDERPHHASASPGHRHRIPCHCYHLHRIGARDLYTERHKNDETANASLDLIDHRSPLIRFSRFWRGFSCCAFPNRH